MECITCKTRKPVNEFPSTPLFEECDHPPFTCLRCMVKYAKEEQTCPYPSCTLPLNSNVQGVAVYEAQLGQLFKEYSSEESSSNAIHDDVVICRLNGESFSITCEHQSNTSIVQIKSEIKLRLGVEVSNQKLMFQGKELFDYVEIGKLAKLYDYDVSIGSKLSLIVIFYSFDSDEFKTKVVRFKLSWQYPSYEENLFLFRTRRKYKPDAVDGSCFIYSEKTLKDVCYYSHTIALDGGITHTGDILNETDGSQEIDVKFDLIGGDITHLIFTLSAFNAETLNSFGSIKLEVFETTKPLVPLCKLNSCAANMAQAIVVCGLFREGQKGHWRAYEINTPSDGNMKSKDSVYTLDKTISRVALSNIANL